MRQQWKAGTNGPGLLLFHVADLQLCGYSQG